MTDDERPRGSCVIPDCPRDPWPREPGASPALVCGPCASKLRHWLGEIPGLCDELQAKSAPEEVTVRVEVRERLVGWAEQHGWHPPLALARVVQVEQLVVAGALPAAAVGGQSRGGPVSGSPVRRLPGDENEWDLLARARRSTSAAAPLAYPEQDDDQIGFLPVAASLDGLAEGLRLHRSRGERRPDPAVTVLCAWLLERIDDACDDWPSIGECFDEVRQIHGALRGQLGQIEPTQYLRGIPCPKCQILSALIHLDTAPNEPERISCSACGILLTISEYEEYTTMLSAMLTAEGREAAKKAAAERRAVVRLLREMHAVGWRHTIEHETAMDPETGALEPYRVHRWLRAEETIETDDFAGRLGSFMYRPWVDAEYRDLMTVGDAWVAFNGVKKLHAIALAAGVLSVPRERAA